MVSNSEVYTWFEMLAAVVFMAVCRPPGGAAIRRKGKSMTDPLPPPPTSPATRSRMAVPMERPRRRHRRDAARLVPTARPQNKAPGTLCEELAVRRGQCRRPSTCR